jgi:phospholipid/cholesterol/gamma-HCH transport system substrate-binding protein
MSQLTLEAKVGVFFLACLAVFAVVWFSVLDFQIEQGFELKARFDSAQGLVPGAQVQIAGIKVGSVKEIRFDSDTGKAVVVMEIDPRYRDSIPEDSVVRMKSKGLLGDQLIVIEVGKPNARKLQTGEEIKTVQEPADTEKILQTLGYVAQDLQILTRQARKQIVDHGGAQKVDRIITNVDNVFQDVQEVVSDNKEAVSGALKSYSAVGHTLNQVLTKNEKEIDRTIKDIASASEDVKQLLARNQGKMDRTVDQIARFSAELDGTGNKINRIASNLENITQRVETGRGTLGRLVADEALYRQADALVRDVRGLTGDIRYGRGVVSRLIQDPELYYEARRTVRNLNKTAEDISEATPISTLATVIGAVVR